jgi:DNA-binding transcriptional LysR family regulator
MELRHLRYFIAAAEEEHFGRAADRLHVTRPAVSQIIADLEGELGTLLFERLAHHVRLTAAGRTLLPQLVRVMDELNEALVVTKRVGQGKTGTLNIGYGSLTLMHSIFRAAVKQFRESYPDVTLSLFEMSTTMQPKALAEGKIHAGFMHYGPNPTQVRKRRTEVVSDRDGTVLNYVRIQTNTLGVAVPIEHRLAQKRSVTLEELAEEQFVVVPRSSSSPSYGQMYALCQKAGFEPNVVQEVSTIASQLNLISCGMGIGLAVMGKGFTYPSDLSVVPLESVSYSTNFIFGWVKGEKDPILERMIDIVKTLAK